MITAAMDKSAATDALDHSTLAAGHRSGQDVAETSPPGLAGHGLAGEEGHRQGEEELHGAGEGDDRHAQAGRPGHHDQGDVARRTPPVPTRWRPGPRSTAPRSRPRRPRSRRSWTDGTAWSTRWRSRRVGRWAGRRRRLVVDEGQVGVLEGASRNPATAIPAASRATTRSTPRRETPSTISVSRSTAATAGHPGLGLEYVDGPFGLGRPHPHPVVALDQVGHGAGRQQPSGPQHGGVRADQSRPPRGGGWRAPRWPRRRHSWRWPRGPRSPGPGPCRWSAHRAAGGRDLRAGPGPWPAGSASRGSTPSRAGRWHPRARSSMTARPRSGVPAGLPDLPAGQLEVLAARQMGDESRPIHQGTDPCQLPGSGSDRLAEDRDASGGGADQAEQDLEGNGLARPVGADQAQHLAPLRRSG